MSVATLASCDYGNFRYNRNVRIVSIVGKVVAVGTTVVGDGTSGVVLLKPSTAQPNDQRVPYDFEMTVNASRNTFLGQKGSVKEVQAYVGQSSAYVHIVDGQTSKRRMAMSRAKKQVALVYGSLTALGAGAAGISLLAKFIWPIFDPNIATVLLPASLAFLAMVGLDFWFWGSDHVKTY